MDEKRLRELAGLNEARGGQDPQAGKSIANDLVDVFKLSRGKKKVLLDSTFVVLQGMDVRERAAVRVFVANLADELDPDVPTQVDPQ